MGLIMLLYMMQAFFVDFPSLSSPFDANWPWPGWLKLLVVLVIYGAIIYSQIYRYRRVSTPLQRQQTKWIILGLTAALGILIGLFVISSLAALIPHFDNPTSTIVVDEVWGILPYART